MYRWVKKVWQEYWREGALVLGELGESGSTGLAGKEMLRGFIQPEQGLKNPT